MDVVQFGRGRRSFNFWPPQPHPPGYPLFIFFGWLGTKLFNAGPESSLYGASAFGGGLFVAAWFLIIRLQFSERRAWWVASCLLITQVVCTPAKTAGRDVLPARSLRADLRAPCS